MFIDLEVLSYGLAENSSINILDLSHNLIGSKGDGSAGV